MCTVVAKQMPAASYLADMCIVHPSVNIDRSVRSIRPCSCRRCRDLRVRRSLDCHSRYIIDRCFAASSGMHIKTNSMAAMGTIAPMTKKLYGRRIWSWGRCPQVASTGICHFFQTNTYKRRAVAAQSARSRCKVL